MPHQQDEPQSADMPPSFKPSNPLPQGSADRSHAQAGRSLSRRTALLGMGSLVLLGGCERVQEVLARREPPLPGRRESILGQGSGALDRKVLINPQISLEPAQDNKFYTHAAGSPHHRAGHFALSSQPQRVWSVRIGDGNARRQRLTSEPVIVDQVVFTLDAKGIVSARSLESGRAFWSRSVMPQFERSGFGGGLAYDSQRLYVTAGLDYTVCLDARTGKILWYQRLAGPSRSTPVAADGKVFIVTLDNRVYALNAGDGKLAWEKNNPDSTTRLLGGSGLAYTNGTVVAAFGNGEVQALSAQSGRRLWDDTFAPLGVADTVLGEIADITAPPVIAGERVYVTSQAGRTAALERRTGRVLWEASLGSRNWPSFSGKHLFLVTESAKLVAMDIDSGAEVWVKDLPSYANANTRRGFIAWHGPTLAGGRLFVGGEDRTMAVVDPLTGRTVADFELSDDIISPAAVANRTMLVLTADGLLHAYR